MPSDRLDSIRAQRYPLSIEVEDAEEMTRCIRRIMDFVPPDDVVFVRGEYAALTSALLHPSPEQANGE